MNRYTIYSDQFGLPGGDAYVISDTVNAKVLAANTPKTDTVPAGSRFVLITATATTFFRNWGGGTLTVPGDVADGSAPELVPSAVPCMRALIGAQTFGTMAAGSATLTVDSTDGITINDTLTVKGAAAAGADLTTTVNSVNASTRVVVLAAAATTGVASTAVTEDISKITVISPTTANVTLAYFK